MYNFFNSDGTVLASMDPVGSFYDILVQSFNFHYKGNRSPFGIWLHPAFLMADPVRISDLNRYIVPRLSNKKIDLLSGPKLIY